MPLRSWFVCVASFTALFSSPIFAISAGPDDQLMLWMAYDGFLEDESKLTVLAGELTGVKTEIPLLARLVEKQKKLFDQGIIAEEDFREITMQLLMAQAKQSKLEHASAYYVADKEISDMVWRWKNGAAMDFIRAQVLYWQKWQSRCQGFTAALAEVQAEKNFMDWKRAYIQHLLAENIAPEEDLLHVDIRLGYIVEREKSFQSLAESCKVGPPFPRLKDFGHFLKH